MVFVGLTGAVGSGKSEALSCLRQGGVPVLSTDRLGHILLNRSSVRRGLLGRFGAGILGKRGRVDRGKLADRVFKSAGERRVLEGLLYPEMLRRVSAWKKRLACRRHPPALAVVEVPLLHERGWASRFEGVLCIQAPDALRRRRLRARGWDGVEIRRRESIQWSVTRKARASDWVVVNNGSRALLRNRLRAWRHAVLTGRPV